MYSFYTAGRSLCNSTDQPGTSARPLFVITQRSTGHDQLSILRLLNEALPRGHPEKSQQTMPGKNTINLQRRKLLHLKKL